MRVTPPSLLLWAMHCDASRVAWLDFSRVAPMRFAHGDVLAALEVQSPTLNDAL